MTADVYPLQGLLVTLAGWVNRQQPHVIEYLIEENRVLKSAGCPGYVDVPGRCVRLSALEP